MQTKSKDYIKNKYIKNLNNLFGPRWVYCVINTILWFDYNVLFYVDKI